MKIVAKNNQPVSPSAAASLEKDGNLEAAAIMYEQLLKLAPDNLNIMARLMIIYKKLKKYRKEIIVINKAIIVHQKLHTPINKNRKVRAISSQLNSLLGHTDRKGKNLLVVPEVEKLAKRKLVASKKSA